MNEQSNCNFLVIGDIHARLDYVEKLRQEVLPLYPAPTRLLFLGDYIDRGPQAHEVVDALLEIKTERPDSIFLMGNHEKMLQKTLQGNQRLKEIWMRYGGPETLTSYGLGEDEAHLIPRNHLELLTTTLPYYQCGDYFFTHAGIKPGVPLAEQHTRDLLWIRDEFFSADLPEKPVIVVGHTVFDEPQVRPGLIALDTGAVYGGALTALKLPEMRFHRLECKESNIEPWVPTR